MPSILPPRPGERKPDGRIPLDPAGHLLIATVKATSRAGSIIRSILAKCPCPAQFPFPIRASVGSFYRSSGNNAGNRSIAISAVGTACQLAPVARCH